MPLEIHETLKEESADELVNTSTFDQLQEQIFHFKDLFERQEGTLQQFHEALDENKSKNQEILSMIKEFKVDNSGEMRSPSPPR